jgi:hypothetical protein
MSDIITAIKIAEASKEAVHDEMIMDMARQVIAGIGNYSSDMDIRESDIHLIFKYSAMLASATATYVSHAILGDEGFDAMAESVDEFDEIGRSVFDE